MSRDDPAERLNLLLEERCAGFKAGMPRRFDGHRVLVPLVLGTESSTYLAQAGSGTQAGFITVARLATALANDRVLVQCMDRLATRPCIARWSPPPSVRRFDHGVYVLAGYDFAVSLEELRILCEFAGVTIPAAVGIRILVDGLREVEIAHACLAVLQQPSRSATRIPEFVGLSARLLAVGLDGTVSMRDFTTESAILSSALQSLGHESFAMRYAAPEQVWGTHAGKSADLWAAGIIAWETLSGKRFHEASGGISPIVLAARGAMPSLRSVSPAVPARLADVVSAAMALDPAARFADAEELRRELSIASERAGCLATRSAVAEFVVRVAARALAERHRLAREVAELLDRLEALDWLAPDATTEDADTAPMPAVLE